MDAEQDRVRREVVRGSRGLWRRVRSVLGASVLGASVLGVSVLGASVLGASVLGASVLGCAGTPFATIRAPDGSPRLRVEVEIARTAEERMRGLRGRDALPEDLGLALQFPIEGSACIVNTGVPFAIDAVFADTSGVVRAVERGIPGDDPAARCHDDVRLIVELAAGVASPVAVGDVVEIR